MVQQESRIMLESTDIHTAAGAPATRDFASPARPAPPANPVVYEMRSYQLHPGYGSVPVLVKHFKEGIPHKVKADPEGGQLVFFG
jgi:hypothetical protein